MVWVHSASPLAFASAASVVEGAGKSTKIKTKAKTARRENVVADTINVALPNRERNSDVSVMPYTIERLNFLNVERPELSFARPERHAFGFELKKNLPARLKLLGFRRNDNPGFFAQRYGVLVAVAQELNRLQGSFDDVTPRVAPVIRQCD